MTYKDKIKYVLSDWIRLKFMEIKELKNCDDGIENPLFRELTLLRKVYLLIINEDFLNTCLEEAKERAKDIELL